MLREALEVVCGENGVLGIFCGEEGSCESEEFCGAGAVFGLFRDFCSGEGSVVMGEE